MKIDYENPPIWDQVEDATFRDFMTLRFDERCKLTGYLGREYIEEMYPDTEEGYGKLLGREYKLATLYGLDGMQPIESEQDQEDLDRFVQGLLDDGKIKTWNETWGLMSYDQKRGAFREISRRFSEAFDIKLPFRVQVDDTGILHGNVDPMRKELVISNDKAVQNDFYKSFHSMVFACARGYQEYLMQEGVLTEDRQDRIRMAWRVYSDMAPENSMFWDSDRFHDFMQQPIKRQGFWLADTALRGIGSDADPERVETTIESLKRDVKAGFLSAKLIYATDMKVQAAQDTWHAMQPIFSMDIRTMTPQAQQRVVLMAKRLHDEGEEIPEGLNNSIEKILASYPLTEAYKRHQLEKQAELLNKMYRDETLIHARENWHTYPDYKKTRVMQHAANLHGDVFDYMPCRVETYDMEPQKDPATGEQVASMGFYEWGRIPRTLKVNTNKDVGGIEDFMQAMNTTMHEAQHAYQDHLAKLYERGKLDEDHPLHDQARYFHIGHHVYVTFDQNVKHYHNNPLEQDAWAFGNGVSYFAGVRNERQRMEYGNRLQNAMDSRDDFDIDLTRGLAGSHPSLAPPPEPDGHY